MANVVKMLFKTNLPFSTLQNEQTFGIISSIETDEVLRMNLQEHFKHYQDRGMVKWQGFMLSEHNAQIERLEGEANKVIPPKPQMEQLEMDRILNHAYTKHIPVKIQLNASTSDKGVLVDEVTGWLLGDFDHDGFSLDSDYVLRS